MKIGILICCRTESQRLPQKALREIQGKKTIEILIERVKHCHVDEIILCTTQDPSDDVFIPIAQAEGISLFRGERENVIQRQRDAALQYEIDFVISLDGDDLLVDSYYVNQMLSLIRLKLYDVILTQGLPLGLNVIGFSLKAIERVIHLGKDTGWHEFFKTDRSLNKAYISPLENHIIEGRFTLDYAEDLEFFEALFEHLSFEAPLDAFISYIKENPSLIKINMKCNARYWVEYEQKIKNQYLFLVIGLGSMGKRRIRNLRKLGYNKIIGMDHRVDRCKEARLDFTTSDITEALDKKPDMVLICVPPKHHAHVQSIVLSRNIPSFCEASVISRGMQDLHERAQQNGCLVAPSATLRFHEGIKKVKELIDAGEIGEILTFTHESSSHLADWHPYEQTFYAFEREQGATKEIVPFELAWLTWIFGDLISCKACIKNHESTPIDDIYSILLEFKNGIMGHLLVSTISPTHYRFLRVIGTKGILYLDWNAEIIGIQKRFPPTKFNETIIEYGNETFLEDSSINEEMYVKELEHFINSVLQKEEYHYSLEDDFKILNWLKEIERDAELYSYHNTTLLREDKND